MIPRLVHLRKRDVQNPCVARSAQLQMPPRIKRKLKRAVCFINKTHNKIDESLNIISVNSTMLTNFIHDHRIISYSNTLQVVQNDFVIATKILLVYRIVKYFIDFKSPASANVAIYTVLSCLFIFASENFIPNNINIE